jgi:hypothetical protein
VAVQSPETTRGRDARSTVAEMESQETAGSTGVNSHVACLMLALFGHAPISGLRLLSGVKRKLDFELRRAASGAKRSITKHGRPLTGRTMNKASSAGSPVCAILPPSLRSKRRDHGPIERETLICGHWTTAMNDEAGRFWCGGSVEQ